VYMAGSYGAWNRRWVRAPEFLRDMCMGRELSCYLRRGGSAGCLVCPEASGTVRPGCSQAVGAILPWAMRAAGGGGCPFPFPAFGASLWELLS
jgi:hypothetical protein